MTSSDCEGTKFILFKLSYTAIMRKNLSEYVKTLRCLVKQENREVGVNPTRTHRCKQRCALNMPLNLFGKAKVRMNCESEDLP